MLFALTGLLAGCAAIPPPRALEEADRVSQSPAAREVKELASPSWARAEKRRLEAHEALDNGPQARAQFLAEEAIALYSEGVVLARLAKATLREKTHEAEQTGLDAELSGLDAQQSRAAADVDALEAKLRALRTITDGGASGPDAEAARRDAARSFLVQAKLLCTAARALREAVPAKPAAGTSADDPTSDASIKKDLDAAEAAITAAEAGLADPKKPASPDIAASVRADCSSVLARTRRATADKTAGGASDSLLDQLSEMAAHAKGLSMSPERDERGVVVVLRDLFDGETLKPAARERLAELDRVAAANARFPVAVVLHSDKPLSSGDKSKWQARSSTLLDAFGSVGKARKVGIVADDAMPLVSRSSSERAANARVEIVFIAPEAL